MGEMEAARLAGAAVSSSFFSVLGVRFALGRNFLAEEDLPGNAERMQGIELRKQLLGRIKLLNAKNKGA